MEIIKSKLYKFMGISKESFERTCPWFIFTLENLSKEMSLIFTSDSKY